MTSKAAYFRICCICGKSFSTIVPSQLWCSDKCGDAYKQIKKESRLKVTIN